MGVGNWKKMRIDTYFYQTLKGLALALDPLLLASLNDTKMIRL
jgi:hypothetical protein